MRLSQTSSDVCLFHAADQPDRIARKMGHLRSTVAVILVLVTALAPAAAQSPSLTSIAPGSVLAGGPAFTLTANGSGFTASSIVQWNTQNLDTTYANANLLTAIVPAGNIASAGTKNIRVQNPGTGGGYSTVVNLYVNNPVPLLVSLSPASAMAGDPDLTLAVTGSGFIPGSVVRWRRPSGATYSLPTTHIDSGHLTALVSDNRLAIVEIAQVTVVNPTPVGGISVALPFTISQPTVSLNNISPSSRTAGGAGFLLEVNGEGFTPSCRARWNGTDLPVTTFLDDQHLEAPVAASLIAAGGLVTVTVFDPSPSGGSSNYRLFTVNNPHASLTSISPTSVTAGGTAFVLTLNGQGFNSTSVARWNGTDLPTLSATPSTMTAQVAANLIVYPDNVNVEVFNPPPQGGSSGSENFDIHALPADLISMSQTFVMAGAPGFTLQLYGTGFYPTTEVRWDGASLTPTFVSPTTLTVAISTQMLAFAEFVTVGVHNDGQLHPSPSWSELTFQIRNPPVTFVSLSPASAPVGTASSVVLTVTGTGFNAQTVAKWNGSTNLSFNESNSTTATVTVPSSLLAVAGTATITLVNPAPGGGTSVGRSFAVENPLPVLTSLYLYCPLGCSIGPGSPGFPLHVTGTGFNNQSVVRWNSTNLATTFVSSTHLTFQVTANLITGGVQAQVRVFNPAPGGGLSNHLWWHVDNPVPVLSSVFPTTIAAGSAGATLSVYGSLFNTSSRVRWSGADLATTMHSSAYLTAQVPAAFLVAGGYFPVTVFNPAPVGGTSVAATITVTNPVPILTSIAPVSAPVGTPGITLTVSGSGFVPGGFSGSVILGTTLGSTVIWDGVALPTVFVSSTSLMATVGAALLAAPAVAIVSVFNPPPLGGFSAASLPFVVGVIPPPPDSNPVTFSVNGPVDPHTEGIGAPRGGPAGPGFPGNPYAATIRFGSVPPAVGLAMPGTPPFPGEVSDFLALGIPSEAALFQASPMPPPVLPAFPDGVNNQILLPPALGLVAGPSVPPMLFASPVILRDNIDAISNGEDFFPAMIMFGLDPDPLVAMLPTPGTPLAMPWPLRFAPFKQPIVLDSGAISWRFSVDSWAIGLPLSAVNDLSGGADDGGGAGPWTSPGGAAAAIFSTLPLLRVAGVTLVPALNDLVHAQTALGLGPGGFYGTPVFMFPAEDDVDGLECVGSNTAPWPAGVALMPGSLHARVAEIPMMPDPPPPDVAAHEPVNTAPLFFSVSRSSPGAAGTAVRTSFSAFGGAGADIFVSVKIPGTPDGEGLNLLFIDNAELGLLSTDDLDGLVLWIDPAVRGLIVTAIESIAAAAPGLWSETFPGSGIWLGEGMSDSIVKLLGPMLPPGSIRVGFSVTTDSVGMMFTAVDYEAGPVFPAGTASSAAGDIFFAVPDGSPVNTNYLWFEEMDLGLDAGAWVNGASFDLADLADNLDALDSTDDVLPCAGAVGVIPGGCPGTGGVPSLTIRGCPMGGRSVSVTVKGGLGGAPAFLAIAPALVPVPFGPCPLPLIDLSAAIAIMPITLGGASPTTGTLTLSMVIPPGFGPFLTSAQAGILDPGAALGLATTNAVTIFIP